MNTRLTADNRRDQILTAALAVARTKGYQRVTRDDICAETGCSPATITYHFTTMKQLRRAIMREAIRKKRLTVLAQGLVARDEHAKKAPPELKDAALATIR